MAINYGMPFGPTSRAGHMVTGVQFFDDFIGTSLHATADFATWQDVATSGTAAVTTTDEPNGAVDIVAGNTNQDGGIELNGEPFKLDRQGDAVIECRVKASSIAAATGNFYFGLHEEAFDVASGVITNQHLGFSVKSGAPARLLASSADDTTQNTTDTSTDLVAATYVVLTVAWRARAQKAVFYVDGAKVATHTVASGNLPLDSQNLTIGIHAEGATTTRTFTCDYILYAGDRTN